MAGGSIRYRAEPESLLLVHELGPMTLVYHRRSGITHMMSEPLPQILEAVGMLGCADAATLTRHLGRRFDLEADDSAVAEAVIAARLDELAILGLVMREPA